MMIKIVMGIEGYIIQVSVNKITVLHVI